jgi:glutamine synthetase type III
MELEILLKQRIHRLGSYISTFIWEQHYVSNCFISYTGEALDYKTPLLRALQVMDEAATDVCKYFDKKRKLLLLRMGTRVLF